LNRRLLLLFFISIFFSISLYAEAVLNIDQPIKTLKISDYQLKSAIVKACQNQNWNVRDGGEGRLSATFYKSNYMAKINIRYAPSFYTLEYADSKRMRYDGKNIHPTYNRLIKALQANIIRNLKTGNYVAEKRVSPSASCQDTFQVKGDIWSGQLYSSSKVIKGVTIEHVIERSQPLIKSQGFKIDSSSPQMGLLNASKTKRNGHVYPLYLTAKASKSGVIAKLKLNTPAGASESEEKVKMMLCSILEHVGTDKKSKKSTTKSTHQEDIQKKLVNIKNLYEAGLITEDEYNSKRRSLIDSY